MARYRRARIAGGSFFFTVNLADRGQSLLTERIDDLREAVRYVRARRSFEIDAMVVLPEHLHAVWTLPPGDADHSTRWSLLKSHFSRRIARQEQRSESRILKRERGIWQRRYWEHAIRDEDDLQRHVDYIHSNPVKHRHVQQAVEWPYSTFHRFVAKGMLSADWGANTASTGSFGERG